jgi:16S rRNA (adenine1518-N6/adenine1519-N6)-dimethyltransferase
MLAPIKALGQNFIQDKNICNKIVDLLGEIKNKNLIEIGPGMGALTGILLAREANVIAFDVDNRAVELLNNIFCKECNSNQLKMLLSDIRDINLKDYTEEHISIIGNIPYNITNDIVFWLFENSEIINKVVLTIQREVAERYVAKPRTKEYGITTLAMQLYADAKIAFHIPASAFFPKPKVTSSVIVIDFSNENKYSNVDKKEIMKLIKAAFSQRRKVLANSLKTYLNARNIDIQKINDTLLEINLNFLKMRAEELNIDDYILLYGMIMDE